MKPDFETEDGRIQLYCGDCTESMKSMPSESVNCCVTSPPYWGLRDYGCDGQLGLEKTPEEYVANLVAVFREVRRVLRDDGTLWLNLGDSYFGSGQGYGDTKTTNKNHNGSRERQKPKWADCELKPKDLAGIPWRVAFALQADGWYLRSEIIWHKPNPMPESVTDRPTKSHEQIFLLAKSADYFYDAEAVKEDGVDYEIKRRTREHAQGLNTKHIIASDGKTGLQPQSESGAIKNLKHRQELIMSGKRNKRSVWTVATQPFSEAHFATFPPKLITPCILAGCPVGGTVIDPFGGSGTTALVAIKYRRKAIICELKPEYCEMSKNRIKIELQQQLLPL